MSPYYILQSSLQRITREMSNPSNSITPYKRVTEEEPNRIPAANNEIALDSLPYIDNVHPDYEAYALSLIEEEMQRMEEPTSNATQVNANTTPKPFLSSNVGLNKTEYESLIQRGGQPRQGIDYTQQMRDKNTPPSDISNPSEWGKSIERAKIELEYERLRMVNAELQTEYESSLWKIHSKSMEAFSNRVKSKLENQQLEVDKVNATRKEMQEDQGAPKLMALNARWESLIKKSQHLARAVGKLEGEVEGYRSITGVMPPPEHEDTHMEDSDDNI